MPRRRGAGHGLLDHAALAVAHEHVASQQRPLGAAAALDRHVLRKIGSECVDVKWFATSTSIGVCASSVNS